MLYVTNGKLRTWNFPNLVGAIDHKHVAMKVPDITGSLYYSYKSTFSVVLLALVDANLQFIYTDIGSYGRNSDGGTFACLSLRKALTEGKLNFSPVLHFQVHSTFDLCTM